MRSRSLLIKMTAYYAGISVLAYGAFRLFPQIETYLPIGGAQSLLSGTSDDPFEAIQVGKQQISDLRGSMLWIIIALTAAAATALPVCWTYIACRIRDEYDNSIVRTIFILPMLLTSIVLMVHNSLALAFSLAGIVGAVRFRNSLKSPGDALYILMAICIGLSAGIGAVEIAVVMTIFVNYCFILLWHTQFGVKDGAKRYMRSPYTPEQQEDLGDDTRRTKPDPKIVSSD